MSGPDLQVFTLKFLVLKKCFFHFFWVKKMFKKCVVKKDIVQLFSADAIVFPKNFFDPEKVKKWASKVAHNRPRPFYFTVQRKPEPTAQI